MTDYLMAPVTRIASPDIPVPFSPVMEGYYRLDREDIKRTVLTMLE